MIKTEPYLPFEANTLHDDTDLVDVRCGSNSEVSDGNKNVRSWGQSRHNQGQSRHRPTKVAYLGLAKEYPFIQVRPFSAFFDESEGLVGPPDAT